MSKKYEKENNKKKKLRQTVSVDAAKILKEVIRAYDLKCEHYNVPPCFPLRRQLKISMDESKLLQRFIIDPKDRRVVDYWEDEQLPVIFLPTEGDVKYTKIKSNKKVKKENQLLVKILPLLEVLRNWRYIYIQELFIWEVLMEYDDICALSGMLARSIYQFIRIEMVDCFITAYCLSTFALSINACRTLQELVLDFNEFGDNGCKTLCTGLKGNRWLLQLSLCYCNLRRTSGLYLGELIVNTPIRELFLDGNSLKADGVILLLDLLSMGAELEGEERQEQKRTKEELDGTKTGSNKPRYVIETDDESIPIIENPQQSDASLTSVKKVSKSKKKSKNNLPAPPPVGPQINKLRVADNGIDQMGRGGNFAPMRCMQLFKNIIANSIDLEEIDLFGNDIGELGSRQLLEGLNLRKVNKLPQIGLRVGHRINQDTFDQIAKLAPRSKKKKGKSKNLK